jgi:hypothetical protein
VVIVATWATTPPGARGSALADKKNDEDEWEEMTQTFRMRISPTFLTMIDNWRRVQDPIPSRSEAVRKLVDAGIEAESKSKRRK